MKFVRGEHRHCDLLLQLSLSRCCPVVCDAGLILYSGHVGNPEEGFKRLWRGGSSAGPVKAFGTWRQTWLLLPPIRRPPHVNDAREFTWIPVFTTTPSTNWIVPYVSLLSKQRWIRISAPYVSTQQTGLRSWMPLLAAAFEP